MCAFNDPSTPHVPLEKLYERDGAIQRKSCSDPVPTCSQPCQRLLKCGVPGSYHECQALCHEGPCPPCPLETPVKCRCGAMDCNILCSELTTKADEVTCKKPCKKLFNIFVDGVLKEVNGSVLGMSEELKDVRSHTKWESSQLLFADGSFWGDSENNLQLLVDEFGKVQNGEHLISDSGWRCPACQSSTPKVPNAYRCFCAKVREPEWNRRDIAHSCGEICGRSRKIEWCKHKCNILCHPGPCPPCTAFIKKQQFDNRCFCGKNSREVVCTQETFDISIYECEDKCLRTLECNNHQCKAKCHPGSCKPCERAVHTITRCPCGKVPLEKLYERDGAIQRKSCSDPVPTCSQPCQRLLKCGVPGSYHECQALCHEGPCPPCPLETPVKCRCGAMDCNILCSELTTKADEVTCKKPCKKMRHCSRHKCSTKCCIDVDHICTLVCGRMLTCGLHKCEEPCHRGNCPRCWQTSFEELTCHCGASVLYPPVPCGTKPPVCDNPCRRPHSCPHEATHLCHPDEPCPPCTMLVDKPCFGNHKIMLRTLCYLTAVSCGGVCGRPLPCGLHKCQRVCHELPCVPEGTLCTQKCLKPRESCGHPCANPCHTGLCPDTSCKEMVMILCECGHRKRGPLCSAREKDREYLHLSKQKSCIHSFAPMNREKRQFVHEYCEHFGCQSQSYDEEPKKNVVATAVRGMCYLPPVSVLTVTQREQGQRKVPAPVWTRKSPMK
nr:transcriptional repressor NF-X1-like [Cherax quadricarinatus]